MFPLITAFAQTGPIIEKFVGVGSEAFLPCDVTSPFKGDAPFLVIFFKGAEPIYSLDAREKDILSSIHWTSPRLESRKPQFVVSARPQGLLLPSVEAADDGNYHCRVDFTASPTRNLRIRLHVAVPPSNVRILDTSGREQKTHVGPFRIGETPTLKCVAYGGRPEPNVTWRLGTSPLNKTFQSYSNNVTFSKVTLPPITRDFWNQNIRCEARSTNLTKLISSSVKLDLILPPKEVKIQGSLHPFREGKPLKLFCVTKGSQPLANITWWKNGTLMKNFKIKFADNFTGSTLYLTPRREDDMAFMKCRAKNPLLPKEIVEDRFRLRVQYPPRIRIQPGTRVDISGIKEGDDIYFECIVEANPMINIIEWYLNENRLYQNVSSGIIVSGRSLVVQGITRHFSGKYHCRGKNILASAVSKTIKLNVKFLPECKQGQQTTYGGARNETLNITCDVTGQPLPTRFFWSYNASSEIINLSHIKSKNSAGRSTLFYKPKRNSDFGALLCWAKNDVGRQKIPCVYQVVPASNPESVKNCSVTGNPSSVDIIVECEPGWNGGLHQSFLLQVRKSHLGPILATIRNQDKPKFFVDDLKAGNEFLLTVLARNSRGFSIATNIAHFVPIDIAEERLSAATVSTRKEDKQSLGSFLLAIIVGTLVVLSIIATAAFFFVRSRNFANRPRRQNLSTTSRDGPSTENLEKETDEEERDFINQEQEEVLIPTEGDMTKRVPPQRKGAHAPKKRRSKFVSEEQLLPPKEGESLEDQRIPSQNENDSPILKEDTSSFSQPETAFPLFSHSSVLNTQILSSHHTTQPSSGHSNLLQNDLIADVSPTLPSPHEDERHIVSGLPSSVNGEQTTQALCETSYIRRKLRGFTKNSGDRESFV